MVSGFLHQCSVRKVIFGAVLGVILVAVLQPHAANAQLADAVAARRVAILSRMIERPSPNPDCSKDRDVDPCVWGKLVYTLAALTLNRNAAELASANERVREATNRVTDLQRGFAEGELAPDTGARREARNFYFLTASLLARVYYVSRNADGKNGRLTPESETAIARAFWSYARAACKVADADPSRTWDIWGSENHHITRAATCLTSSYIVAEHPVCGGECRYSDGSTPAAQSAAWTAFWKEFIKQRAKYGGFVEYFSQTYWKYSLQALYVVSDYARDAQLRRSASALVDVWWAEWSQEQVGGLHGGSKARAALSDDTMSDLAWYYFGIGPTRPVRASALLVMITGSYSPPAVVREFAVSRGGLGTYESRSRRAGLLGGRAPAEHVEVIAPARGGILRYAYSTPTFAMGTGMVRRLPAGQWAKISSQNRWSGLVLAGGEEKRVYAWPRIEGGNTRALNTTWGVQHKATQIVQKLPAPLSTRTGPMTINVGDLPFEQQGDWIFIDSTAYVAIRPAFGGVVPGSRKGQFDLRADLAPVIIQAAEKKDYGSFAEFKRAVAQAPLDVDGTTVKFRGLNGAGVITFFHTSDRLPEIDGKPIELDPSFAYSGPILSGAWGEGVIKIGSGAGQLVHDFR